MLDLLVISSGYITVKRLNYQKGYMVYDEPIIRLLVAIDRDYPVGHLIRTGGTVSMSNPIAIQDLGKLGEQIIEAGGCATDKFTHFLVVGDGSK